MSRLFSQMGLTPCVTTEPGKRRRTQGKWLRKSLAPVYPIQSNYGVKPGLTAPRTRLPPLLSSYGGLQLRI